MERLNLFVPQWQDSGHSNEIYYGSQALKNLLADTVRFNTISINEHGELKMEHDIFGYQVILDQLREVQTTLYRESPQKVLTVGGGCGVDVPIVSYLIERYGSLQLCWFDAHGDINSPATSSSKYFHGMALRFLLESFEENAISDFVHRTVPHSDVVLLGTRDLDEQERLYIESNNIRKISSDTCNGEVSKVENILTSPPFDNAYIHIDLDAIDPGEYRNVKCPARKGISISRTAKVVAMIRACRNVVGISILENMETDRRQLEKLRPIIEQAIDF